MSLGARKPNALNRMVKIGYWYIMLGEIGHSFNKIGYWYIMLGEIGHSFN
jgi:hypothetical protein